MLQFSKIETTIFVLLFASVISVALFECFQREVTVRGNSGEWFTEAYSDVATGGNSLGIDRSTDSQLRFEYRLDHSLDHPLSMLVLSPNRNLKINSFAAVSGAKIKGYPNWQNIEFDENKLLNLDWMERVHVVARVEGKQKETFRVVFRTRIDRLADDAELISRGFTQGLITVTDQRREFVLTREQFQIPTWWLEKPSVDLNQHKVPMFTPLDWIELSPSSMASGEKATLVIDSIKFQGHFFPSIAFYSSVLGVWMLAAVGVLIQRSYKFAREVQLLEFQVQKANVDFLTGLLNRNSVSETMDAFTNFTGSEDAQLSLVMFDIDNFKMLNDNYGHNYGDVVLSNVGRVVSTQTQHCKLTAVRWGGEEFLIFAEGHNVDQATELAELMRQSIQDSTSVTCSFGVYELCREDSMVVAIGRADKALYASKWLGRNRVSVFGDEHSKRLNKIIGDNVQESEFIIVGDDGESVVRATQVDGFVSPVLDLPDLSGHSPANISE